MAKRKPKGWRNESTRHSLASKGIKSGQKIKKSKLPKKALNVPVKLNDSQRLGMIMDYESGQLSDKETLRLFSDLIRNGMAWTLQGHYGRTAVALIDSGWLFKDGSINQDKVDENSL